MSLTYYLTKSKISATQNLKNRVMIRLVRMQHNKTNYYSVQTIPKLLYKQVNRKLIQTSTEHFISKLKMLKI